MAELESLLGRMRSSQFKGEFDAQSTSERTQQLQERNTLLEEQVRHLQAAGWCMCCHGCADDWQLQRHKALLGEQAVGSPRRALRVPCTCFLLDRQAATPGVVHCLMPWCCCTALNFDLRARR